MRLARVGSVPRVMLTFMPGFNSAAVAFCPLTLISVNCVMVSVFAAFGSVTVIEFALYECMKTKYGRDLVTDMDDAQLLLSYFTRNGLAEDRKINDDVSRFKFLTISCLSD